MQPAIICIVGDADAAPLNAINTRLTRVSFTVAAEWIASGTYHITTERLEADPLCVRVGWLADLSVADQDRLIRFTGRHAHKCSAEQL